MNSSLVRRVKDADGSAIREVWQKWQEPLERYANGCFRGATHISRDGEGAVQSALVSFWKGLVDRRFEFEDESGLLRLLLTLVRRKVVKQARSANRLRRGGGAPHVRLEPRNGDGLAVDVADSQHTPAETAELKDELRRLFSLLDVELKRIAILKMEGHADQAVADALGRSRATIVRKLALIRQIWIADDQGAAELRDHLPQRS
jgi:DNA-directed RNA polymerase specialized sigma24 family protein